MDDMTPPPVWKGWTEALEERLRELWLARDASAKTIAQALDPSGTLTRNAILGKVNRLGLLGRGGTTSRPPLFTKPGPKPKPKEDRLKAERHGGPKRPPERFVSGSVLMARIEAAASPGPIPLAALRDGRCRWPLGDKMKVAEFFCGEPALTGKAYCLAHCRVAYIPPRQKGSGPRTEYTFMPGGSKRTIPRVTGAEPPHHKEDF